MCEVVIEPRKSISVAWKEIWQYRELFFFLAWKDILVRYKQTFFGVAWSVFRPLLAMIIFSYIFGHIAKLPSGDRPYPIMVFAALLPWQFFSNTVSEASSSLIINANMISKVYFPRIIIPGTSLVVSIVDFLISFLILVFLLVYFDISLRFSILTIPLFLCVGAMSALGVGLWFSALNVKYRDFRIVVPFFIQVAFYVSPVGFRSDLIGDKWIHYYYLNPMVGVIDGFRWAILGGDNYIHTMGMVISVLVAFILFISGLKYFHATERSFADVI